MQRSCFYRKNQIKIIPLKFTRTFMESLNHDSHSLHRPYKIKDDVWMIPCKIDPIKHKFTALYKPGLNSNHLRHP